MLTDEGKEVYGYWCQKAVSRYSGMEWTVWFTPEIPSDGGLWKFTGLPGLILEASDDKGEYIFSMRSVRQIDEPILWYKIREKVMKRENFRKMEKNLHDNPILFSKDGTGYKLIINKSRNIVEDCIYVR